MPPVSRTDRARFLAELTAPYRKIRLFVYFACGVSGGVGGLIYLLQTLAGRELGVAIPSLALQSGVVALTVSLYRWESQRQRRSEEKIAHKLARKDGVPDEMVL